MKDISSIRGIADQTNLLALNAAIEAARAGEIQNIIEKLQNGVQPAVKVMASSQINSEETVQQADIAGNSIDAIVSAINIINDMSIQIATAATEQSQVSEDVNVQHIAENSHQVVGMVSDAETACVALDMQCTQLDSLVAQFKV
ncbi:methyl-accepting chemotaxis protein [Psychromonas hadalis]|uniref:methyl-accepting chemotaxis protein n=1 Tax=Psychromonas hadalis TaxID=211669 RepID=UPI0003B77549|nr:methyl-accepting chemotaxis protein [Psychromonas hadalis]